MIPKIIHYSWIGNDMPDTVKERVNSWKETLPDWKFKLWDESNYDFTKFEFAKRKYQKKEWAYATDELRFDVVNRYGGFYFDTDMIIKKDLSEFLNKRMVWGFMYDNSLLTSFFGAEAGHPFFKVLLDYYSDPKNMDALLNMTNNPIVTNIFCEEFKNTFRANGTYQLLGQVLKIDIYPRDYFCFPSHNGNANYAEHLFDNSWGTSRQGFYGLSKKLFKKIMPVFYGDIANKRGIKYSKQFFED